MLSSFVPEESLKIFVFFVLLLFVVVVVVFNLGVCWWVQWRNEMLVLDFKVWLGTVGVV